MKHSLFLTSACYKITNRNTYTSLCCISFLGGLWPSLELSSWPEVGRGVAVADLGAEHDVR